MCDAPGTSWAETADLGYDDGYFSQPGSFAMSNYRDALCCFQPCKTQTNVCRSSERSNSDLFGEPHQQDTHSDLGFKTVENVEARLKRLEELNEKLSQLAQDANSDLSCFLSAGQNRFFPSVRNSLIFKRKPPHHSCCDSAPTVGINSPISMDERKCGARLVSQVVSLQALEAQTHTTLDSMLRSVSEDIPLSQEDIRSIIGRTSEAFAPAKLALASAIKEKTDSTMPRCPKPPSSSSFLPHKQYRILSILSCSLHTNGHPHDHHFPEVLFLDNPPARRPR
jgi:hypothetical protein